jgi:hypothetical protein
MWPASLEEAISGPAAPASREARQEKRDELVPLLHVPLRRWVNLSHRPPAVCEPHHSQNGWGVTLFCIGLMSLPGQSRHFDRAPLTSGLPRLADILSVIRHVSQVPISEVATAHSITSSTRSVDNKDHRSAVNR